MRKVDLCAKGGQFLHMWMTILITTSFDTALRHGAGLPGFITSLLFISFGVGGVKSTVVPYMSKNEP